MMLNSAALTITIFAENSFLDKEVFMSHTNKTTNYSLPQFVGSDTPAWLTDVNQAYAAIDTGMNVAKQAADVAVKTADTAGAMASAASETANAASASAAAAASAASAAKSVADAALPRAGGTMGGDLVLKGNPSTANMAANKAYVDAVSGKVVISGVQYTATISGSTLTFTRG